MNLIRKVRIVNSKSCTVALPKVVKKLLDVKMGDNVEFKIENGKVIIQKAPVMEVINE